jgi:poly(A) polymerase
MRLRADIGEVDEMLADWWQEFSMADDNLRQDMVDQAREEQQSLQRTRSPRVHSLPASQRPVPQPEQVAEGVAETADAPKKRRRRRRSGGAKNTGQSSPDAGV